MTDGENKNGRTLKVELTIKSGNIISVFPAAGWKAVYAERASKFNDNGEAVPNILRRDMVCFALVEDEYGFRSIVGYDGGELISSPEGTNNFLGYEGPGERCDYLWHEAWYSKERSL